MAMDMDTAERVTARLFQRMAEYWTEAGVETLMPARRPGDTEQAHAARLRSTQEQWHVQVARFSMQTVQAAFQTFVDGGGKWPPKLPEFVERCRQYTRPEHQSAPALPGVRSVNAEGQAKVRAALAAYRPADPETDGMRWAEQCRTVANAQAMVSGARTNWRLGEILRQHQADGFERVESEDARRWLRANHGG